MFSAAIVQTQSQTQAQPTEFKDKTLRKEDFDTVGDFCDNYVYENLILDLQNNFTNSGEKYKKTQIDFGLIEPKNDEISLEPIINKLHYGHPTKYNKDEKKSEEIKFTVSYVLGLSKFRKSVNENLNNIELKIYKSKMSDKMFDIIFKKK